MNIMAWKRCLWDPQEGNNQGYGGIKRENGRYVLGFWKCRFAAMMSLSCHGHNHPGDFMQLRGMRAMKGSLCSWSHLGKRWQFLPCGLFNFDPEATFLHLLSFFVFILFVFYMCILAEKVHWCWCRWGLPPLLDDFSSPFQSPPWNIAWAIVFSFDFFHFAFVSSIFLFLFSALSYFVVLLNVLRTFVLNAETYSQNFLIFCSLVLILWLPFRPSLLFSFFNFIVVI